MQYKDLMAHIGGHGAPFLLADRAIINVVSQWWIEGLRSRKSKVMSSILMGGSNIAWE